MLATVSADAWVQAGSALVIAVLAAVSAALRRWTNQIRDDLQDAQADMIRVSDQSRRDTQSALAVISNQVHDICQQLDDTRQRLSRVEALVGQPPPVWPRQAYQPPVPPPPTS